MGPEGPSGNGRLAFKASAIHSTDSCHGSISVGNIITFATVCYGGPGSSVGIVTDYGLDSLGSNSGGDEIFCPSRPALGPTQPPVKWVPGLSRGKVHPGRAADHSPPSSAAVMEE